MVEDIKNLTQYNLWANKRIANWLLSNEASKLDETCASSFSTIELIVNHIWDAEIFYLSTLTQTSFDKKCDSTAISSQAIKGLLEHLKKNVDYASKLGVGELNALCSIEINRFQELINYN
ncbi:hypothetical protein [Kordia sp.]|uniref:hypothetical protein n=1 Tax=Kordia sp. TaxID=1965332 RepID=UPI0025C5C2B6|nr:hypothetical protein [Kordia sp.]MCH2195450.1 hypothetical protein [Kordia sp.]